jgi:hypothetical protein
MINELVRFGRPRARVALNSIWAVAAIAAFFIFSPIGKSDPPGVQVVPGNIKDTRGTEQHPGAMEVELKVVRADNSNDATAYRIIVTKAVDDTGVDLVRPESSTSEFQSFDSKRSVKAELKSPARKAVAIKELSGDAELFCPNRDPAATVVVNAFRKHTGTPIESDTLKSARVQVAAWTPDQYQALQKKREAETIEAVRSAQRQARNLFSQHFGTQNIGMGPNDFIFTINGAQEKLIGFEFRDRAGKAIPTRGSGVGYRQQGPQIERTLSYHFDERLPDTTKLVIFVATPEALVKVPFTLADVAVP